MSSLGTGRECTYPHNQTALATGQQIKVLIVRKEYLRGKQNEYGVGDQLCQPWGGRRRSRIYSGYGKTPKEAGLCSI